MPEGMEGIPGPKQTFVAPKEQKEQETVEVKDRFCEIKGKRVHYLEAGQGEPVILIHGWLGSADGFCYVAPEFAKEFHILAPNLPGCGSRDRKLVATKDGTPRNSQELNEEHTLQNYVEFLHAFVQKLNLPRVKLVGVSMGATLALEWAKKYPAEISKLAVFEPVVGDKDIIRAVRILNSVAYKAKWTRRPIRWLVASAEKMDQGFRKLPQKDKEKILNELYGGTLRSASESGSSLCKGVDTNEYQKIQVPTFLISGGFRTPIYSPNTVEQLTKVIPQARVTKYPEAGHNMIRENAPTFVEIVSEFLKGNK